MRKQTFIPGGIYTDYKNDLAIFTGIYSDSHEEDKNTFILLEDCPYRTHEEIVNYIKRIGIDSIMPYIQMLHLKNDYYAYRKNAIKYVESNGFLYERMESDAMGKRMMEEKIDSI